jgi:hypothetical protein
MCFAGSTLDQLERNFDMSNYDTTKKDSRMVTGLFRDRTSAERAYGSLADRGYSKDDVNLVMSDDTRRKHFADADTGRRADRRRHPRGAREALRRRDQEGWHLDGRDAALGRRRGAHRADLD